LESEKLVLKRLNNIWESTALTPVRLPANAVYRIGKRGVKNFFRDPKSWGFAKRVGMAMICAGLVAAAIGFAPFGPLVTKALIWIGMQAPINIFKDSALRFLKKEIKHIRNSPNKFLKARPRTFLVGGVIAAVGIGIAFTPVAGAAVLNAGLLGLRLGARAIPALIINTGRGIIKGKAVRAVKAEQLREEAGYQASALKDDQVIDTLAQMHPGERKRIFERLHEQFGHEFTAAAKKGSFPEPEEQPHQQLELPSTSQMRMRA
jgi:hypothetical protein